jgi:adenylosuccinate synthase
MCWAAKLHSRGGTYAFELRCHRRAIRNSGEYGTVTGRPRRWGFDAARRFTAQLNGFTELALTKLDVLDGLSVLKIGVGYRPKGASGGDVQQYWEGDTHWLENVEPVYEELPTAGHQSLTSFVCCAPGAGRRGEMKSWQACR